MVAPTFLDNRSLRLLVFGGKGGVGKTTCATATAVRLAKRSPESSFLLVSTDPAHSVSDSLADWSPPNNLTVLEPDAGKSLAAFRQKHYHRLRQIAASGTFLDDDEISRFLDLSLPGLDELMAFQEISGWVENAIYDCIIVDTAPSGHMLRLLAMPEFVRPWLAMLDSLLAKHRYMKRVFSHSNRRDEPDAFLEDLTASVKRMERSLQDRARCRFVPVMLAEAMSIRETISIVKEVDRLKLPVTDIVVNRLYPENPCAVCQGEHLRQARELRSLFSQTHLSRFALWSVPMYAQEVRGQQALESFWDQAGHITTAPPTGPESPAVLSPKTEAVAEWPPLSTTLLIFAGKGGVGKTTLACATALQLAENPSGRKVLLVSTGPAHSLSSCLGMQVGSQPKLVFSGLSALEIDSQAGFQALKKQYAADIERFLESVSGQFDLTFDREVLERILDLSPPGLDEVMALTQVTALLASGRYDTLVLDSASTGHLIRLLELPEIIDQWLKVLFGLFLKYQQVFRLTGFSQETVRMSKNLKVWSRLLSNPARAALYVVSIPTDMALEETCDLLAACELLQINVSGLFLNLVTPPGDCDLCSALYRRESAVRNKFRDCLSSGKVTVVYRRGEVRGLRRLRELGEVLYQSSCAESRVYAA